MSALGHEQTSRDVRLMSVIPLKADIHQRGVHVRFVPEADIAVSYINHQHEHRGRADLRASQGMYRVLPSPTCLGHQRKKSPGARRAGAFSWVMTGFVNQSQEG
jgi:hypothetical protein